MVGFLNKHFKNIDYSTNHLFFDCFTQGISTIFRCRTNPYFVAKIKPKPKQKLVMVEINWSEKLLVNHEVTTTFYCQHINYKRYIIVLDMRYEIS